MLKSDHHLGEGLEVLNELNFKSLNETYQGGKLCGAIEDKLIV